MFILFHVMLSEEWISQKLTFQEKLVLLLKRLYYIKTLVSLPNVLFLLAFLYKSMEIFLNWRFIFEAM